MTDGHLQSSLRRVVDSRGFNAAVIAVILLNAGLIGLHTYHPERWILTLEWVCVGLFIVELAVRFFAAESKRRFLADPWTIFDVVIIAAAFVPAGAGVAPILRILRVLRVLRLIKTVPQLRLITAVLTKSVLSMQYIALLAIICFYVYAVIGVKLFGQSGHPLAASFSSVHEAAFTLFRVLTGDNWSDLRYAGMDGPNPVLATVYFVSWIIVATFVLTNLIVGAIVNNFQQVQDIEHPERASSAEQDERRLREIAEELRGISERLRARGSGETTRSGEHAERE